MNPVEPSAVGEVLSVDLPEAWSTGAAVDVRGLHVDIADVAILADVTFSAVSGSLVGLVGPNGSGKSTLLRSVSRTLRPGTGAATVGDDDVWRLGARDAARRLAVVGQHAGLFEGLSVLEVVELGRVPHLSLLDRWSSRDTDIVEHSMRSAGVAALRDRQFGSLSGGERQRVHIARALAQQPRLLVLDEPTNHLDIRAQLELLELVRSLGVTVLAALHDLNLAAGFCDRVVVLRSGRVVAAGAPDVVLSDQLIQHVYGVRAHCEVHPLTKRLAITYVSVHRDSAAARVSPGESKGTP